MFERLFQAGPVQPGLAWIAGCYLHFVALTTRWQIEDEGDIARWVHGAPCIIAFWHETLPAMPIGWVVTRRAGRVKPSVVLASAHRDGRLVGLAVRYFGIGMVPGSSSRGGAAGLRKLLAALKAGSDVGLTPDGPRGPRRIAAAGVAQLAAISGALVLPSAAWTRWAIELSSWDHMRFPLPFGRGRLVFGRSIAVPRHGWEAMLPAIEAALTDAVMRAEVLQ